MKRGLNPTTTVGNIVGQPLTKVKIAQYGNERSHDEVQFGSYWRSCVSHKDYDHSGWIFPLSMIFFLPPV